MRAALLRAILTCASVATSAVLLPACGALPASEAQGVLEIVSETPNLRVYVDDEVIALRPRPTGGIVMLPAGERRIRVEAEGYLPWRTDLRVRAGDSFVVELDLWPEVEELDGAE